jgi:tRNA threonylcarbamoyl adenosine modification protein YeaZ
MSRFECPAPQFNAVSGHRCGGRFAVRTSPTLERTTTLDAVIVLGLETSGTCGSAALLRDGSIVGFERHDELNAHAERMLPLVESALRTAGIDREAITRVAVGTGPGNFTGLRVGIALSYGLGIGLGIPVVGVCSLAAIADAARSDTGGPILAIRDARKDEFFGALYDAAIRPLLEPCLIKRVAVVDWISHCMKEFALGGDRLTVAGDGLARLKAAELAMLGIRMPENAASLEPDARHVALLGAGCEPSDWPLPAYVREVDAVMPLLVKNPDVDAQQLLEVREALD